MLRDAATAPSRPSWGKALPAKRDTRHMLTLAESKGYAKKGFSLLQGSVLQPNEWLSLKKLILGGGKDILVLPAFGFSRTDFPKTCGKARSLP